MTAVDSSLAWGSVSPAVAVTVCFLEALAFLLEACVVGVVVVEAAALGWPVIMYRESSLVSALSAVLPVPVLPPSFPVLPTPS